MADGAQRSLDSRADRRGLWQALVEADSARRSVAGEVAGEVAGLESDAVIDLAGYAQAHLGYLERVAAFGGDASFDEAGSAVVFDLDAHRSRRALSA